MKAQELIKERKKYRTLQTIWREDKEKLEQAE